MAIFYNIPWSTEKNIGKAYNDFMELLPSDDDFACFLDGDAMLLNSFFGKQLEDIIAKHPECGIFTARTNILKSTWQQIGDWQSNDIVVHRDMAQKLLAESYADCEPAPSVTTGHLLGGVLILIKKSVWKKIGGFANGLLGVDNQLHISAEENNEPVYLMKGVYVFHWYRGGDVNNKEHLMIPDQEPNSKSKLLEVLQKRSQAIAKRKSIRAVSSKQEPPVRVRYGQNERTEMINFYIRKHGYKSYLEIGTQNKDNNFNHVIADKKVCVDPDPNAKADFVMGSDEFFKKNRKKFDIIFIDGLHEAEQVKRDIDNSVRCLNPGGVILVHDCIPPDEDSQKVPRITKRWTGDVWKAMVYFRRYSNLHIEIFEIETGIGVIKKCKEKVPTLKIENPTYQEYVEKRKEWFPSPKKVIYSAITGDYDKPINHYIPPGWEYKLFTDSKDIPGTIYVENESLSKVKLARYIKTMPWDFFDFDICLWIDGNTIFDETKIDDLCEYDFVISQHPARNCIYDEAKAVVDFKKEEPSIVQKILKRYQKEGYPRNNGMVASHAILRKNNQVNRQFSKMWWDEIRDGSRRDQLSFNYVLWKYPIVLKLIEFFTIFKTTSTHRHKVI